MALPKIQQPLFELTIPSTGKTAKYRPFTVKEEKILLIAQESNDVDQMILAIKQIITNCVDGIDVEKLAMFDLEYILLQLRAKSVSNEVEFKIRDPETDEMIELNVDLNDIEIKKFDEHNKLVQLSDDMQLVMRYPKIDQLKLISQSQKENRQDALFDIMLQCIESVVQGEEVFHLKDFSEKEVTDFLESLNATHIKEIKKFFDTMPVLRYEVKYKNKDGKKKTFVAEGTETFFI